MEGAISRLSILANGREQSGFNLKKFRSINFLPLKKINRLIAAFAYREVIDDLHKKGLVQ